MEAFAERVVQKYGPSPLIVVGDWSSKANPNRLRGQEPTMGVGLLRGLAASKHALKVMTTCESYTSSRCPECEGKVEQTARHHLLRCPTCIEKRWWNRDVLGARNILKRARHLLDYGEEERRVFVA
jgi:hypothetical protein